jgi:hypothetical protein
MEEYRMAKKRFTLEEMTMLRKSKYVLKVNPNTIHFKSEFKEKVWELIQSGKTASEAVAELGIDPDILGDSRLQGLRCSLKSDASKGKAFTDLENRKLPFAGDMPLDVRVRFLEQQLKYKDQEIEFLKKIVSLGKGGLDS